MAVPAARTTISSPMSGSARSGRAVVLYDQLGGGRSTHLRDKAPGFWTVELFLAELDKLLAISASQKRLPRARPVLGRHAGRRAWRARPAGLRSLVIANSPASMTLWVQEADRLREALPPGVQADPAAGTRPRARRIRPTMRRRCGSSTTAISAAWIPGRTA